MRVSERDEATAYERRSEVDRELEPAWLAVRRVQRAKGREVWFLCIERSNILVSYNTTGEEGRVCDSRDTGHEGQHGKKGGEPRIFQCPLEECEDGDWEIGDEDLEVNELMES